MNANEISPKLNTRFKRIKIVSRIFRGLLGFYVVILILTVVSCLKSGAPKNPEGIAPQSLSYFLQHLCLKPSPMPIHAVLLELIRLGLFIYEIILLNRLFIFFGRGKFFAGENVRCLRLFGWAMVADAFAMFVNALMQHEVILNPSFLTGLFIILISWIADEGRKIQEEQELTV
jgi:hypothetical protein